MNHLRLLLCCLLVNLNLAHAASDLAAGESWWSRVKILANDNMDGRNTGSEGYRRAADYVAGEFDRLGLKPAGTKGYFQPMQFGVRQIREDQSRLELVRDGQPERLSLGEDANLGLPTDLAERIDAPAVFVGYGLVIPEMGINDLNGLDLKGKIVVFLSGGPKAIPGPMKAHYSHTRQRWRALRQAGAVGIATIGNPKSTDIPWARSTLARLQPAMSLVANHATLSRSALVADLNVDMFLPIHPLKTVRVFGLTESSLGDDIRAVCASFKVGVQPDPQPDRNIFIRSDQYSFIQQGVPSLFFGFGYEPGSPEEQLHKDWLKNRYHAPSDDLDQPVDKAAAAQFNHIFLSLTVRVANAPERPSWMADSFFRRFAR